MSDFVVVLKILILTPIVIEYNGVRKQLNSSSIKNETHAGNQYEIGQFERRLHSYEIVITRTGSRNMDIVLATEKAIKNYQNHIEHWGFIIMTNSKMNKDFKFVKNHKDQNAIF